MCTRGQSEVSAAALILTFPVFGVLDFAIVMQYVVSRSHAVVKYVSHWIVLPRAASPRLKSFESGENTPSNMASAACIASQSTAISNFPMVPLYFGFRF